MVTALLRQRRRLVLAAVAIALSVGYVAGALTLLGRVGSGLDELAAAGADRADLVIEGQVAFESPVEQVRRLVPDSVARAVESVPGVRSVSPRVEDVAVVLGRNGEPVVAPGLSEQPLGASWPVDASVAPYRFVGRGRAPTSDTEVVLDATTAGTAGFKVGDSVTVAGKAKVAPYRLVGIVSTDRGELPPGSSLALFDLAEARKLFDRPSDDNRVAVVFDRGADRAATTEAVRSVVPSGIEVVDAATAARHRQEGLTRSFTLVRVLILGFAGLALLVGTVTVANSLTLLYADRRRTFAAFRLVGASPGQLRRAALVEAAALALAASVVGAPLGLLLGRVIEAALGALGSSVPVAGSVVSPAALLLAVGIGVAATMVAAVVPASRACRVPPIEAVVEAPSPVARSAWRRLLVLSVVALVGGAVVAGALLLARTAPAAAVLGGAAAAGVLAVVALVPYALSFLVAVALRRAPVGPRPLREVGAREVEQHRSRVAATAGALLLATAVVAALTVVLSSFTASVSGQVDRLISADLVVDSGTFTRGGLPGDLLSRIGKQPSVEAVSGWQIGRASVGTAGVRLTGVDGKVLSKVLSPTWVGGAAPTTLRDGQVAVSESLARRAGLEVGAQAPVLFTSGGTEALEVVGVYADGGVLLGDAIVDRAVLRREVPATVDIAGLVTLDPDNAAARSSVRTLARSYGVTSVLRPDQFVASRAQLLRGFERVIQWMLLFTVLQALIGVVNTLLLSIGERRRTIGLMRVAGATPGQVRRMVLVEGAVLALLGTVCGIAVGVLAGWGAVSALAGLGLGTLAVPAGALLGVAVAAVLLGVAASVLPAVKAARVPPLEAVADAGGIGGRAGGGLPEPVRVQVDLPVPPPLPPGLRPPPYPPSPLLPRPVVPREISSPSVPPVAAPAPTPVLVPALVGATVGTAVGVAAVGAANGEPIRARMDRSAAVEPVAPAMFGEEVNRVSDGQSGGVPPFLPQVEGDEGPAPTSPATTAPPSFLPPPAPVGVGAPPAPGSVPPPAGRPMFGEGAVPAPDPVPVQAGDPAAAAVARALFGDGPTPAPAAPAPTPVAPVPPPVAPVPPAPAAPAPPAPPAPAALAPPAPPVQVAPPVAPVQTPPAPAGPAAPLFGDGADAALAAALLGTPAPPSPPAPAPVAPAPAPPAPPVHAAPVVEPAPAPPAPAPPVVAPPAAPPVVETAPRPPEPVAPEPVVEAVEGSSPGSRRLFTNDNAVLPEPEVEQAVEAAEPVEPQPEPQPQPEPDSEPAAAAITEPEVVVDPEVETSPEVEPPLAAEVALAAEVEAPEPVAPSRPLFGAARAARLAAAASAPAPAPAPEPAFELEPAPEPEFAAVTEPGPAPVAEVVAEAAPVETPEAADVVPSANPFAPPVDAPPEQPEPAVVVEPEPTPAPEPAPRSTGLFGAPAPSEVEFVGMPAPTTEPAQEPGLPSFPPPVPPAVAAGAGVVAGVAGAAAGDDEPTEAKGRRWGRKKKRRDDVDAQPVAGPTTEPVHEPVHEPVTGLTPVVDHLPAAPVVPEVDAPAPKPRGPRGVFGGGPEPEPAPEVVPETLLPPPPVLPPVPQPVVEVAPAPAPEPEPVAEPAPVVLDELPPPPVLPPMPQPVAEVAPEPAPEPEPEVEPAPVVRDELPPPPVLPPVPQPVVEVAPEPAPEPEPVPESDPMQQLAQAVFASAPMPEPEPEPEPTRTPMFDRPVAAPTRTPMFDRTAEPVVEPEQAPSPEPVVEAAPAPVPEPHPVPVAEPVAEPAPEPVAEPVAEQAAPTRPSPFRPEPVKQSTHPAGLRFDARPRDDRGAEPAAGAPQTPGTAPSGSSMPATLAEAVRRLGADSRADAAPVLSVMSGFLGEGEEVRQLVQGRVRNLVCLVARTDRRLLVVADRPGKPLVESLDPSKVELRTAPSAMAGAVDLTVLDGRRRMVVAEVRDAAVAEALVTGGAGGRPSYF